MTREPSRHVLSALLVGALCVGALGAAPRAAAQPLPYTGANLAGGEFYDPGKVPEPRYGTNFVYPTPEQFAYFAGKGMNTFRLCFLWETLQPAAGGAFREAEVERLKAVVGSATGQGLTVILDPHNYARHLGKVIGGPQVSFEDFAGFWARLAREFASDERVWFGLMNEPNGLPTEQWLGAANAAIAAIRAAGARNLILVPGNAYTGAHSWLADWYGGANGSWMLGVVDPLDNHAYEVHQYLDGDSSGSTPNVAGPTVGSERLAAFTGWCREHGKRAFLGEFAAPATDLGQQATEDMLAAMERDRDVWLGFTWWAAGAWWGDYVFSLEPRDGQDRPQLTTLLPHLAGAPPAPPPGAAALGYTKCIISERPIAADVAPGKSGDFKWFSGQWYNGEPPSLEHYRTRHGALVLSAGGDLVSTSRDFTGGRLPLLPGPDGFYVEFEVQLPDNDADHWPAVWLMPAEHSGKQEDQYPGDPPGFERWMELDVDEGGFGPGLTGTVHSWWGIWGTGEGYQHIQNPNNVPQTPLDRSRRHTFGASYDPVSRKVTWWVDGVEQMSAGAPHVPEVAAKQHFYLIISNQTHGANKPYDMTVTGVRAFVPPDAAWP
jgi:endoglucanase